MSSVKITSESFDPDFPLPNEIKEMESTLYSDVPPDLRSAYGAKEKLWIAQAPRTIDYVTRGFLDPEKMMPVGVNDTFAVALQHPEVGARRAQMMLAEHQQSVRAWSALLRRCRYQIQFREKIKQMLKSCDKPAAEKVLRDEELSAFRDALPNDPPEDGLQGLKMEFEKRDDSAVKSVVLENKDDEEEDGEGTPFKIFFNRYRTSKVWKQTTMTGRSHQGTFPAVALSNRYLLLAYYVKEEISSVNLYDINTRNRVFHTCARLTGPLRCSVTDQGWLAVSDGRDAIVWNREEDPVKRRVVHTIENQIITCVRAVGDGSLYMGTYNGQLYHVNDRRIISYNKTLDCNAVLSISKVKGTMLSVNGIVHDQTYFNIRRPLTVCTVGTFIISLGKHGMIRIGSTVHSKVDMFFKPPKELRCNVEHVTPWYDDGAWFNGDELVIMYPEGSVRVIGGVEGEVRS
jgi:hypothetical protein